MYLDLLIPRDSGKYQVDSALRFTEIPYSLCVILNISQYLLVTYCVVYELDMEQFYVDPTALHIDKNLENRLNITVVAQ